MKRAAWLVVWLGVVVAPAFSGLAPARAAEAEPGTRTLYLVRHGFYDRADLGDQAPLAPLGREQARLVGKRLAKLPVKFDAVVSSRLPRAVETADLMAHALKLTATRDSLLNECTPPSSREDIMRRTRESEADSCLAQLESAWAAYARPSPAGDRHELLVCHGNVIRWFVTKALGADTKQWGSMDIAHCSVTIVTIKPDGAVRLVLFSDAGHLPLEKLTWAGKGPGWSSATSQK